MGVLKENGSEYLFYRVIQYYLIVSLYLLHYVIIGKHRVACLSATMCYGDAGFLLVETAWPRTVSTRLGATLIPRSPFIVSVVLEEVAMHLPNHLTHLWSPGQPRVWTMGGMGKFIPSKCLPHPLWVLGPQPLALDLAFHLAKISWPSPPSSQNRSSVTSGSSEPWVYLCLSEGSGQAADQGRRASGLCTLFRSNFLSQLYKETQRRKKIEKKTWKTDFWSFLKQQ